MIGCCLNDGKLKKEGICHSLLREEVLGMEGGEIGLEEFSPGLGKKQQIKAEQIEARLLANPFQPLLWSLISKELFFFNPQAGEELRSSLEEAGVMVQVGEDLYFHRDAIAQARDRILEYINRNGSITCGQARDLLGSSRKFIIPLLEYLDAQGFTIRKGNERVSL